jgi:hypothetical protein
MVQFKPDVKLQKRFKDIDFESLSLVFSACFDTVYKVKKKRNFTIHLKLTAGEYSYYAFQQGSNVRINISELVFGDTNFVEILLHEFRHFVQDKAFKVPFTKSYYDDSTEEKYLNSPCEIDADDFVVKSSKDIFKIYKKINKFKKAISAYNKFKKEN